MFPSLAILDMMPELVGFRAIRSAFFSVAPLSWNRPLPVCTNQARTALVTGQTAFGSVIDLHA
jgi:hypothetical protein